MKLQLSSFDKIIFDMDGVITSEMAYWQTAAICAYDLLIDYTHYGKCGIDREWCRNQYLEIYNTVLCGGRTVRAVKRLGVNTNWDLAYIVFCVSKYLDPDLTTLDEAHFKSVCMFIENIDMKAPEIYDALAGLVAETLPQYEEGRFKRDNFWKELYDTFALWYCGNDEFEGIRTDEELLFPVPEIEEMLKSLKDKGLRLGIGTGRPKSELEFPLNSTGLYKYFDKDLVATYDDVVAAEKELNSKTPLAKPDPFVFLKAALGDSHTNKEIKDGDYSYNELSRVLVVGDAPSDMLAAQRGGFQFLAVLTGIEGENARSYFTENKADYILNSFLSLKNYE